jgi:hypothetical protein
MIELISNYAFSLHPLFPETSAYTLWKKNYKKEAPKKAVATQDSIYEEVLLLN